MRLLLATLPSLLLPGAALAQTRADQPSPMIGLLHHIVLAIEVGGVAIIVLGMLLATVMFLWAGLKSGWGGAYACYRANLGRGILLGLELLVAADIINTVAIEPTLQSLLVLGLIVLIRTFLSFSLEVEIEGRWPWQRNRR